jgi:pimeloyl-ACP methyl ester carboxylesterase
MFLDINGQMVHTVVHGAGPRTVVGLAGVFGNMEIWQLPFEILHHSFRTIAFDHLGTGETHVPDEQVTFDRQVALVGDVLDALEVETCLLAGDSSLAAVAVAAAARWPKRVDGLVLVAGRVDHTPVERTRRFVAALRDAFEPTLGGFVDYCLPEDERGHLRRWLYDIIARTGSHRAAHLVESFYDVDIVSLLPTIAVPALVIHGELDAVNTPEEAQRLAAGIPDARLLLLENCGHVPTLSHPDRVADAIADFAGQHARAVPTTES